MNYSFENFLQVLISIIILIAIKKLFEVMKKIIIKLWGLFKKIDKSAITREKVIYFINVAVIISAISIMFIDTISGGFTYFMSLIFSNYKEECTENIVEFLKIIFKFIFWISIIINIVNKIYEKISNYRNGKKQERNLNTLDDDTGNNTLYKNLYEYFCRKDNKSPIVIEGEWGAGKTYAINEFFENYYKYKKQNIYRISCFGISTREQLVDVVKNICEKEDKSLYKEIIELIAKIPILGSFLKNIFGRKYDLNSLKANSIFIFDNFERIEPYYKDEHGNNKLDVLNKYNIVTGFIDTLIEIYNMKVVILVNPNDLIETYSYENFIGKLGSKLYRIDSKNVTFAVIWNEIISSFIMQTEIRKKFDNIFEKVKYGAELIWKNAQSKNIRLLRKAIYNYIEFIKYLTDSDYAFDKQNNEEIGIFYTCIIESLYTPEEHDVLESIFYNITKGENISTYIEKCILKRNIENNELAEYFRNENTIWYSSRNLREKWKNLENYHYTIQKELEIINVDSKKMICLNKFDYLNIDVSKIESVAWEDIVCMLVIKNGEFFARSLDFIHSGKVIFNRDPMYVRRKDGNINGSINLSFVLETIMNYRAEDIFENEKVILAELFDVLEKKLAGNLEKEKNQMVNIYRECYTRLYNSYKEYKGII